MKQSRNLALLLLWNWEGGGAKLGQLSAATACVRVPRYQDSSASFAEAEGRRGGTREGGGDQSRCGPGNSRRTGIPQAPPGRQSKQAVAAAAAAQRVRCQEYAQSIQTWGRSSSMPTWPKPLYCAHGLRWRCAGQDLQARAGWRSCIFLDYPDWFETSPKLTGKSIALVTYVLVTPFRALSKAHHSSQETIPLQGWKERLNQNTLQHVTKVLPICLCVCMCPCALGMDRDAYRSKLVRLLPHLLSSSCSSCLTKSA